MQCTPDLLASPQMGCNWLQLVAVSRNQLQHLLRPESAAFILLALNKAQINYPPTLIL